MPLCQKASCLTHATPSFYYIIKVGFGNVWRFPALSVSYGGGAFFIPYLMALFFIGIPILILEIGFGQFFQTGDVNVFGGFHPRFRGVGVASVACGFVSTSHCVVIVRVYTRLLEGMFFCIV